ncbi:hypothetical protein CDEF62S_04468 [Castellaniella defragrans]
MQSLSRLRPRTPLLLNNHPSQPATNRPPQVSRTPSFKTEPSRARQPAREGAWYIASERPAAAITRADPVHAPAPNLTRPIKNRAKTGNPLKPQSANRLLDLPKASAPHQTSPRPKKSPPHPPPGLALPPGIRNPGDVPHPPKNPAQGALRLAPPPPFGTQRAPPPAKGIFKGPRAKRARATPPPRELGETPPAHGRAKHGGAPPDKCAGRSRFIVPAYAG